MKRSARRTGLVALVTLSFLALSPVEDLRADRLKDDFAKTINSIEEVPYNPRPLATNTADVTGILETDDPTTPVVEPNSRSNFLAAFTRVTFPAPANGRTFASSSPANHPDITLVGYIRIQKDSSGKPVADRPGIILTHGGVGDGSVAGSGQFLIHIANVLVANGYHVLAFDRRDGLLSRCGYKETPPGTFIPDPAKSQEWRVGGDPAEDCDGLSNAFRRRQFQANFHANSLPTSRGAFESGDFLAAAKFLQDQTGTGTLGALGGSRGGITVIRAASIQGRSGSDFPRDLLAAILVLSPVADDNTNQISRPGTTFSCERVDEAQFYSGINGSGLRNFAADPAGAVEDYLALANGVKMVENVEIPVLIIHTLTDDATTLNGALAYKVKTDKMKLGHTLLLARLGHASEIWQADPYWMNQVTLTYFKLLLAKNNPAIGDDPGFSSLGPNIDNPLVVELRVKRKSGDEFLSQESIVPYWVGPNGACVKTGG